ncbi:MAG TPA: class I SAM-dependent methyltransferase [Candidatus Ozemobacteraceae bacterium]|nr:class I SAM-dependent methyltransferase [Candidatus Ozemobacteraceae bacterium]
MSLLSRIAMRLVETGFMPDILVRLGLRTLNWAKLYREHRGDLESRSETFRTLLSRLKLSPIAVSEEQNRRNHFEVPPEFFGCVLGTRLRFTCCYFPFGSESLDDAEESMLRLTAERARLANGQKILDLSCGWGDLTLWMAERFPDAQITAVTRSVAQCRHVTRLARQRDLRNVEVTTSDIAHYCSPRKFDRIIATETLERCRNYQELMHRIAGWLEKDGLFFVQMFMHRELAYVYDSISDDDWMGKRFFTGGLMPSDDLLLHFQDEMAITDHWRLSGRHYAMTAEHWLQRLDAARAELLPLLEETYGKTRGMLWFRRWRVFFLSIAEMFDCWGGEEWGVSQYLFRKRPA